MYEIYSKIRDINGYKDSEVANKSNVTKSTFTDWKNGRSIPKDDKMQRIANFLGVSTDFLKGKEKRTTCPDCGFYYDPLDEISNKAHNSFHIGSEPGWRKQMEDWSGTGTYYLNCNCTQEEYNLFQEIHLLNKAGQYQILSQVQLLLEDERYKKKDLEENITSKNE